MPKPPTGKKYDKKYTEQDLMLAIAAIKNGMPKKQAARVFNIPRATLQFRVNNEVVKAKPGPPTVLTNAEEQTIVEWIVASSKKGFPRRKEDILHSVEQFLEKASRPCVFINNKPGEGWYKLFLKRHPEISSRTAEAVTSASANVSEQNIRKWFQQIENLLKEEQLFEILGDPNRIFNGDETGFQLCPKQGKVLAQKGIRDVYEVDMAPAKSSITVMFTFSASGTITPPMVIFPLKRMRTDIRESVPSHWGVSLSETGWMTKEIFYQYITNVLHPYLISQNVVFPIILFLDGHKSHINYELSIKCKELGIVLIALYPNATRILQPADVAAFRPIKNGWRKAVLEWRRNNVGKQMTKVDFGGVLNIVLENHINSQVIINGFRACGLHPWNADAIDFSKCLGTKKQQTEVLPQPVEKSLRITDFQKILGEDIFDRLKNEVTEPQNCYHKAMFEIYKFFKYDSNNSFKAIDNQQQLMQQEKLLIDDSWFPIDDIPIFVSQNTETLPTHMLNDQDVNLVITDQFKENYIDGRETSNSTQQIIHEPIDIQNIHSSSVFLPNYNENCNNQTERYVKDNSENTIQLSDNNKYLQIDMLKELQNNILEKGTISPNNIEDNFEQTVCKDDTSNITAIKCISTESVSCENNKSTQIEIRDCLDWPLTPVRKGRIVSEKPLYVLTAAKWLDNEEMKRKDKEKFIQEKEQRKKLREATKHANVVQKQNKKVSQEKKKKRKTEKQDVIAEYCKETIINARLKRKSELDILNNKKQKTSLETSITKQNIVTELKYKDIEHEKAKRTEDIPKIDNTFVNVGHPTINSDKKNELINIFKKTDWIKTDTNFREIDTEKLKAGDIAKTNMIQISSNEKNVSTTKKVKIISVVPLSSQLNVKRKLFDVYDLKGKINTARAEKVTHTNMNETTATTRTNKIETKESKNTQICSDKKVNILSVSHLPNLYVKNKNVDEKPIATKQVTERRATFRNEEELQDFLNTYLR